MTTRALKKASSPRLSLGGVESYLRAFDRTEVGTQAPTCSRMPQIELTKQEQPSWEPEAGSRGPRGPAEPAEPGQPPSSARRGLPSWTWPWVGSILWRHAACGSPELCVVGVNSSVSRPEDGEERRRESQLGPGESGYFILGDAPPGSVCTVETRKVVGRIISFPDLACELHQRLMQTSDSA